MINKQCTLCNIGEFKVKDERSQTPWEEIDHYIRGIHYGSREECIKEFSRNAEALSNNLSRSGIKMIVRWNFENEDQGYYYPEKESGGK